jgi:hypothetical protein
MPLNPRTRRAAVALVAVVLLSVAAKGVLDRVRHQRAYRNRFVVDSMASVMRTIPLQIAQGDRDLKGVVKYRCRIDSLGGSRANRQLEFQLGVTGIDTLRLRAALATPDELLPVAVGPGYGQQFDDDAQRDGASAISSESPSRVRLDARRAGSICRRSGIRCVRDHSLPHKHHHGGPSRSVRLRSARSPSVVPTAGRHGCSGRPLLAGQAMSVPS